MPGDHVAVTVGVTLSDGVNDGDSETVGVSVGRNVGVTVKDGVNDGVRENVGVTDVDASNDHDGESLGVNDGVTLTDVVTDADTVRDFVSERETLVLTVNEPDAP